MSDLPVSIPFDATRRHGRGLPLFTAAQINALPLPLLGILLFSFCTLIRPSRLGEDYSAPGTIMIAGLAAFYVLYIRQVRITRSRLILAFAISLYWLYLMVYSMVVGNANGYPVKALMLMSLTAFAGAILTSSTRINNAFVKSIIYASAALSLSAVVTLLLIYFGISLEKLHIFDIRVSNANGGFYARFGQVLFPLTIIYDRVGGWGVGIPRIAHWFREVGIAQAFFAWAALAAFFSDIPFRKSISMLILLGTLLTLSTVAPFDVAFCLIVMYLAGSEGNIGRKLPLLLIATVIIGIGVFALFTAVSDTYLGLGRKLASASFSDRQRSVQNGIEFVMAHPFGAGVYNGTSAINLVAALSELGLPGALGFFGVIGYAIFGFPRRWPRAAMLSPILFTMFLSEPLLDSGYLYLLLFCTLPPQSHKATQRPVSSALQSGLPR